MFFLDAQRMDYIRSKENKKIENEINQIIRSTFGYRINWAVSNSVIVVYHVLSKKKRLKVKKKAFVTVRKESANIGLY